VQCIVYYSVLQRVAVCCSVLQYVAIGTPTRSHGLPYGFQVIYLSIFIFILNTSAAPDCAKAYYRRGLAMLASNSSDTPPPPPPPHSPPRGGGGGGEKKKRGFGGRGGGGGRRLGAWRNERARMRGLYRKGHIYIYINQSIKGPHKATHGQG